MKKFTKRKNGTVVLLGKRLFDPRIGKFRRPGNQNPALIFYDLLKDADFEMLPVDVKLIKKMADYFDQHKLRANFIQKPTRSGGRR